MPSKARGAAGAEPIAIDSQAVPPSFIQGLPPQSTEEMTKEVEACWTLLVKGMEGTVEEEPDGPRRENLIACLNFAREHGYPEEMYCLWAVDGVARCMDSDEFQKTFRRNVEHMRYAWSFIAGPRWLLPLPLYK
ncbi:hypothetical protein diail_8056 [Diaporthe ilicicola]|nr:hypothetical protein diail_8056 [Diaporthe ilicicola]